VVLVAVYLFTRYKPKLENNFAPFSRRKEPLVVNDEPVEVVEDLPDTPEPCLPDINDSLIVSIRLMARQHKGFPADKLILALREMGLQHGKFGIFHRPDAENEGRADFSVANLVEPGSFDLTRIKKDYYSGVSIFLMLPGPDDGVNAFDDMLTTSRSLAEKMDGELFDEQGSTLSIQRERYLREEVVQFQHQLAG
jgi:cell division protein ZipA